ncbi:MULTISPECIES: TetR/AcrR family transcriptional regulator [Kocuria]|uniref:TetR/AcrR family transcriptional regulator n=1 Tax=Kocuria subflava TaxID=1736139 RepID=A0A846TNC5_9MICC|nr:MULTISPECIES: TetR/AcrR family transcriptional regulator [unclassified Kocuria]NKE08450.1 TetR/AcrR family transcriptional regulator [Kocuria subflava]
MKQEPAATARRRGRPTSAVLSPKRITSAATKIIHTRGVKALTMSALASDLGVSVSALYNHTPSKHHVLLGVQDALNAEIDCSGFGTLPWDQALTLWARSYREVYARNVELIPVMAVLPVADAPHTLCMYESVAAALVTAGFPPGQVVNMIVAVESLLFGSAYDATAPGGLFNPGKLAELAPTFTGVVAVRTADPAEGADQAFELALEALLTGFRTLL